MLLPSNELQLLSCSNVRGLRQNPLPHLPSNELQLLSCSNAAKEDLRYTNLLTLQMSYSFSAVVMYLHRRLHCIVVFLQMSYSFSAVVMTTFFCVSGASAALQMSYSFSAVVIAF